MITQIFILLILFQIKHFLCDYPLQTKYMLGKFKKDGWIRPLSAHCGIHALFTYYIVVLWSIHSVFMFDNAPIWWMLLPVFDFVCHFTMDRIKAAPHIWGKYKPHQERYWINLGIDQKFHHLTHYAIIWWLVT